jgi:ADP-heptose:LPS heptosyltransferase
VVICGSGAKEEARAAMMADGHGGDVLNLVNQLPWNDYVATMAAAAHVICLESSSQHLAAGLGIPMTVVYGGSTNWFQWGPGPVVANIVTHKTPCFVCNRSKCTHRNCIALVSSEEVFRAVYDKVGRETGLQIQLHQVPTQL